MKDADIERRIADIAAGQQADPDLDAALTRRDDLRQQRDRLSGQRASAEQQLEELERAMEAALLAGKPVDDRPLSKTQDAIRSLDSRLQMHDRALTEASRRVTELEKARAVRTEALLRPIFVDLVAQLDAQAEALAATERLLEHAHHAATNALQSAQSSQLVHGYATVFVPEQRLAWWRERVIRAGLLPAAQRVA